MSEVHFFEFSPFSENTYVVWDESGECVIFDPGCYDQAERDQLVDFIKLKDLKPVKLINTHCHIDHVFGNKFIAELYNLELYAHKDELKGLLAVPNYASVFGLSAELSPEPSHFIEEGQKLGFGSTEFELLHTPGHSPGSISFVNHKEKYIISGDVLFQMSVGRVDLPGGDGPTLMKSIKEKLLALPDEYIVYSGHGPKTSIGFERKNNPFLTGAYSI